MKLVISPEDFKAHGSYHFSYPLLVERYKKGEALVQPHPTTEKDDAGKKKKKVIRKGGEDDYDIDDPFIDDCQVTTQFESIFQLMSGEGESADPSLLNQDLNFYIYRGPLQVDIIEKEFDPVKRKKKKTKKAIKKTENTAKPAVEKKKATASMEVKKKKREKPEKLSTLTEQIKEMEDKMDTVGIKTNPSTKKPSPIKNQPTAARKQYDTDNQVAQCEYTEVLEEFSKQAASIVQFDPAKFPNALRPQLEAVILAYLRIDSNFSEWKDTLFDTLATKIPYAAGSLKRLALKKVLPMMLPTEEKLATSVQVVNNEARILVDAGKIIEGKAKFSETLREAIYSHVRLEIAKVIIERAILISEGTTPAPSSINLQDVKRNAFKQVLSEFVMFRISSSGPRINGR